MMRFLSLRSLTLSLLAAGFVSPAKANDFEIAASAGIGFLSKSSITSNGNFPNSPYTTVNNNFTGPWMQGGISLGYETYRKGKWSIWAQCQYSMGLAHPSFEHQGENVSGSNVTSESFHGATTYHSLFLGLGINYRIRIGEVGMMVGPRTHDLSVEGSRQNRVNGTFINDHYSTSYSSRDTFLLAHITFQQDQGQFRSFQRISFGTGFGGKIPSVNPGPSDWKMSSAYLAQTQPNSEFRIALGVRY